MQFLVLIVTTFLSFNSDFDNVYQSALSESNLDSAIVQGELALEVALNPEEEAMAHLFLGDKNFEADEPNIALRHYYKALGIYETLHQNADVVQCYLKIGNLFEDSPDYEVSLIYFKMANEYAETHELNLKNKLDINQELGDNYQYLQYYDSAISYYEVASLQAQELNEEPTVHDMNLSKARCLLLKGEKQAAKSIYDEVLSKVKKGEELGLIYYDLGKTLLNEGDTVAADGFLDKAYPHLNETPESSLHLIDLLKMKAAINYKVPMKQKAYLEEALLLDMSDLMDYEISIQLSEVYEQLGYSDEIDVLLLKIRDLSKSLTQRDVEFDDKFQSLQMEAAILAIQNREMQLQNEENRRKNLYFKIIYASICVSLFGLLSYLVIRNIGKRKRAHQTVFNEVQ